MPTPKSLRRQGLLFGLVLGSVACPLMAQSENTTITTTTTTPAVPVAPPPVAVTQMITTTTTTLKARTLYLRAGYHGEVKSDTQVFVRPNGRIYDGDAEYIGHLTNLDGEDLQSIPDDRRYKIRNLNGSVIASTKLSSSFDSDRTISLAREDSDGHLMTDTTSATTPVVAIVTPSAVQQSSTTTTTTQSLPATQTSP